MTLAPGLAVELQAGGARAACVNNKTTKVTDAQTFAPVHTIPTHGYTIALAVGIALHLFLQPGVNGGFSSAAHLTLNGHECVYGEALRQSNDLICDPAQH